MARATGFIDFDADVGSVGYALGAIDGLVTSVDTSHYINAILVETHAQLARKFDTHMRVISASNPKGFKHVFEWNMVGILKGKLWRHHLRGYGRSRTATFDFAASKTPIPRPTPRSTGVSQKELDKLSKRRYVFRWKARIIEFGIPVDIRPKNAKRLFVPLRGQTPQFGNAKDRERAQQRGFVFAQSVHIDRPGGDAAGNFTTAWFGWWGSTAEQVTNSEILPRIEKKMDDIATVRGTAASRRGRYAKKTLGLAWSAGKAQASAVAAIQEQQALAAGKGLEALEQA